MIEDSATQLLRNANSIYRMVTFSMTFNPEFKVTPSGVARNLIWRGGGIRFN